MEISEFVKLHEEISEVKLIGGRELYILTCLKCNFKRIDKNMMQTILIGRKVWRQQHYDYVNSPDKSIPAYHDNSDSLQTTIPIPENIKDLYK